MTIVELNNSLEGKYEEYLLTHSSSLFYSSLKFRNFISHLLECEPIYLLAMDKEEVKGVLPLMRKNGELGYVYNSLPYYGSNGGIIADDDKTADELLKHYMVLASDEKVLSATIISNPLTNSFNVEYQFDEKDERIGQLTPLENSDDFETSFFSRIDSTARRNIKKAIAKNFKIQIDNEQEDFLYRVHSDNMKAAGAQSKSKKFFQSLKEYFVPEEDYNIYIAYLDGVPVAGLLLFYFNKTVEYYTPAILTEYRTFQPLALTIYRAVIDAAKRGFTLWNWGGTHLTMDGVYKFKKKWDSFDKHYYYYTTIRNELVKDQKKERLLNLYPNFFVIPFSKLR